jgi:hypothetical protein
VCPVIVLFGEAGFISRGLVKEDGKGQQQH